MASLFSFGRPFASVAGRKAGRGAWRWRGSAPEEPRGGEQGQLSALIEREIIPRLVAAHPRAQQAPALTRAPAVIGNEVATFTTLVMTAEVDVLLDYLDQLIARAVPNRGDPDRIARPHRAAAGRILGTGLLRLH